MDSQGHASDVTQEPPKKFTPQSRRPRMDARSYKKLFIRKEVQVFKAQGDQVVRRVVQVSKTQDQEPQEEVGQNF